MKKTKCFLGIVMMLLLFSPAGGAAGKNGPAAPANRQQEQYEKSMEERLRKLGKELDELKARTETLANQARTEAEGYLAEADKKRKEAARVLDEMKTEGGRKWSTFKGKMNSAMEEFEKAFERAQAHFKE